MTIRTFQPGDEVAQADIYNAVASALPGYKPAMPDELRRRSLARGFDPTSRFYAIEGNRVVGYATIQSGGRISYPWCLPGSESFAERLHSTAITSLKNRGVPRAFVAYHKEWTHQAEFFVARGFRLAREMVNFVQELTEMPTMIARSSLPLTPLKASDVSALYAMAPDLWNGRTVAQLERDLFDNPQIPTDWYFGIRGRSDNQLLAAAVLVRDPTFADATTVDPWQPCFRLGTFGTEGQSHKRVDGLFSFVAAANQQSVPFALNLMMHAAAIIDANDGHAVAAQCPSDQPHLLRFYQTHFRRQGHFLVFERTL